MSFKYYSYNKLCCNDNNIYEDNTKNEQLNIPNQELNIPNQELNIPNKELNIPNKELNAPIPNNELINLLKKSSLYINLNIYGHKLNNNKHSNKESLDAKLNYNIYTKINLLNNKVSKVELFLDINSLRNDFIPSYFMYYKYKKHLKIFLGDVDVYTCYFINMYSNINMKYNFYKCNNMLKTILDWNIKKAIPSIGLDLNFNIDNIEDVIHKINIKLLISYYYQPTMPITLLIFKSDEIDIFTGWMLNKLLALNINYFSNKKRFSNSVLDFICYYKFDNNNQANPNYNLIIETQINLEYIFYLLNFKDIYNIFKFLYINLYYFQTLYLNFVIQFILYEYSKKIDDVMFKFNLIIKIYIQHNGDFQFEILISPKGHYFKKHNLSL